MLKADSRWNLAYELRVLSLADTGDMTITRMEMLGPDHKKLFAVSGDDLKGLIESQSAVGTKLGLRTYNHALHVDHR